MSDIISIGESTATAVVRANQFNPFFYILLAFGLTLLTLVILIIWRYRMKKKVLIPILLLALLGLGLSFKSQTSSVKEPINLHGVICWSVNGVNQGCKENVVTNVFKDDIETCMVQGGYCVYNHIALGNTTAPAATDTSHPGRITGCGLDSADGTFVNEGTGNWTIYHTWTSSCNNIVVNTTGIYNDTNAGHYGGGTTITSATLQSSDTIQVNFTRWVS
jgi:heme exporter protein CcmD